jgi:putative sigma-54 modulation protein
MQVAITGRHMEVSDALKAYIENGLTKIRGHFDKVNEAEVVLCVEKHRHIAEIILHANGARIHGRESSPDMYASVDAVLDKLDKQVRRFKDRISRHQNRKSKEARAYEHQVIEMMESEADEQADSRVRHRVVLREKLPTKPMSVEEAAMQLDLVEDRFLVFSNADTNQINVIYAREDGTYGLIEPEG